MVVVVVVLVAMVLEVVVLVVVVLVVMFLVVVVLARIRSLGWYFMAANRWFVYSFAFNVFCNLISDQYQ